MRIKLPLACLILAVIMSGCHAPVNTSVKTATTPAAAAAETSLATPVPPSATPQPSATATAIPTETATATPTDTPAPVKLGINYWASDPILPILLYHQFATDNGTTTALKVTFSDFRQQLQDLYDAGYSLVPLQAWLQGDYQVQPGRRALAFTIDDMFFNNQFKLTEDGQPDPQTGVGILWYFYQEHPDFGFHGALFATIYDKQYTYSVNQLEDKRLAAALAWLVEHDMRIYNHTDAHIALDKSTPKEITKSLGRLDDALRKLLVLAGREDLSEYLDNMFALTYSIWPQKKEGVEAILNYKNPEDEPMIAVFEADYIYRPNFLPAPYDPEFNVYKVPRTNAGPLAVEYLVENNTLFPVAHKCMVTLPPEMAGLGAADIPVEMLQAAIQQSIASGICQAGIFEAGGRFFQFEDGQIVFLPRATPTPTPTK